jgi:type II secretion system protein G
MSRKQKGFTLIELLIVVAIIGILAAIAIPNLLTAMQRSKQKRTMADMRSVATAWEARATDVNEYSVAGYDFPDAADTADVVLALSPTYIKNVPTRDGWESNLEFGVTTNGDTYGIKSYGKDQSIDGDTEDGATTDFDCDIVYMNGAFVRYPTGMQQQ